MPEKFDSHKTIFPRADSSTTPEQRARRAEADKAHLEKINTPPSEAVIRQYGESLARNISSQPSEKAVKRTGDQLTEEDKAELAKFRKQIEEMGIK